MVAILIYIPKPVAFDNTLRIFPTVSMNISNTYLLGIRSKEQIDAISVKIGDKEEVFPVRVLLVIRKRK